MSVGSSSGHERHLRTLPTHPVELRLVVQVGASAMPAVVREPVRPERENLPWTHRIEFLEVIEQQYPNRSHTAASARFAPTSAGTCAGPFVQ